MADQLWQARLGLSICHRADTMTTNLDSILSSLPWCCTKSPSPQSHTASSNSPESAAAPVSTYSVCSSYWYVQSFIRLPFSTTRTSHLQEIIFIYRIIILQYTETSLTATGPGTLTSKGAKAAFYLLQSVVELCFVAFLLVSPMRQLYGVGQWGDPWTDRVLNKRLKEEEERVASDS